MFESDGVSAAGTVSGWQRVLAGALGPGTEPGADPGTGALAGLDDAGRIEAIRALEELVCTATAAQAQLATDLDSSQRLRQAAKGVPGAQRGRGVAKQIGLARRESHHRARRHLGLAKIVTRELPHTWAAWRSGRITEWTATLIARETACLSVEHRAAVDQVVAGDPGKLEAMGLQQVVSACQASAARLDPGAVVKRRRRAEADRHVSLRPAPECMTRLSALLPVKDGVGVLAALTKAAASGRAAGDPRTKGQLMADTLVAAVLGTTQADSSGTTAPDPADPTGPAEPDASTGRAGGTADGPGITLGLVMSDQALFGDGDAAEGPAHLDGYGPIPAELARELIAGACSRGEKTWLRRLYTHPTTGELVTMDTRARLFRNSLARFIRLRDQTCRTPWCDAPIRHTDHAQPADEHGETSGVNGQGLCEACNYAKQAPDWHARPSPGDAGEHQVETTTPTGHRYRTRPPAIATIRETPIRIDYVLTC
ncbi:DUF222 domain-containing protein [Nocardioides sp.]|uniref:DUF222 domain-containing protein n=1 Tax=Nocardioides sp. TaxID=35761 RepID=UPI002ED06791